ncbi:sigma 54-interacting transcriptional regulator [Winogradskyella maritima]|nr:sigma 54-interacting transcriptional regulator [Winogradskyella maritima]
MPKRCKYFSNRENGTGKELIARELHKSSARNNEVFISVDMGSISENFI